jgi:hypothetical protein
MTLSDRPSHTRKEPGASPHERMRQCQRTVIKPVMFLQRLRSVHALWWNVTLKHFVAYYIPL